MRIHRTFLMLAAFSLAMATTVFGQTVVAGGSSKGQAASQTDMKDTPQNGSAGAEAQATAKAETKLDVEAVRKKGAAVPKETRAKAEAKIETEAKRLNDQAGSEGDAKVAARLAAEFGMTADQLTAEKNELKASWGELMIAHSLEANTKTDVTTSQLFDLRKEGMGWGQIAAGLGLKLGETVSAVHAETRVATGKAAADGKVAAIHGEGARVGVGVGAGVGAGAHGGGVGVAAQSGVGIKIKP